jgi:hypothetical protein
MLSGVLMVMLAGGSLGCNVINAVIGRDARITKIIAGGNAATGKFDCWLTLEFDRLPKGIDPKDVEVRFTSIALVRESSFDWSYIASHDVLSSGTKFGSGYHEATATQPNLDPPLGEVVKVRFPLRAKEMIESAPSPLWLHAELYWGGKKQDSTKDGIDHAYSRTEGGFF